MSEVLEIEQINKEFISERVKSRLSRDKIETPMTRDFDPSVEEEITTLLESMLEKIGLDLTNDSLSETPRRLSKMYVRELFWGLNYANFPKITTVKNDLTYNRPVEVDNISFCSLCEHHFATIDGKVNVKYIPADKVIGLSKINRIVVFFARRPQIQERFTKQIHAALCEVLETDDVYVEMTAEHYCVKARGIMDSTSITTTSYGSGKYQ